MFDRFNDGARQAMGHSRQEATRLGHSYIGTEHMLLGLAAAWADRSGTIQETLGLDLEKVRAEVEARVEAGARAATSDSYPFTPGAKTALECCVEEAVSLGDKHIKPGHLLLGLLREEKGVAAQALRSLNLDLDLLRSKVAGLR